MTKIDPKSLTIDARKLMRLSVSDRNQAIRNSTLRDIILNSLTPYQIAMMFPQYYKEMVGVSKAGGGGAGGSALSEALSGMTDLGRGSASAPSTDTSTTTTQAPASNPETQTYYQKFMSLVQQEGVQPVEMPSSGVLPSTPTTSQRIHPVSVPGSLQSLANERRQFAEELKDPWLRQRLFNIMANEQGTHPEGTLGIVESVMNRAHLSGHTLRKELHWTSEKIGVTKAGKPIYGYYAGREGKVVADLKNPIYEQNLAKALGGSNITTFATDNNSGKWGEGRIGYYGTTRMFEFPIPNKENKFGGEHFVVPGTTGNFPRSRWLKWKEAHEKYQPNAASEVASAPVVPQGKGQTMLFLHGLWPNYGGKKPEQVEAEARRYAAAKGLNFEAIKISGGDRAGQVKAAIERINQGGISNVLGFSAGGYNMKSVIAGLSDEAKRQIQGVTIVGAGQTGKIPGIPTELFGDPPSGHMNGIAAIAEKAEQAASGRVAGPQTANIQPPPSPQMAMDVNALNELNLKRPDYFKNILTFENDPTEFPIGSGGRKRGSIPIGQHEVLPGRHMQSQYPSFVNNSYYVKDMFDPKAISKSGKVGDIRSGVLIHKATDWDKLYSAGCIAVHPKYWELYKQKMDDFQKRAGGGPVYLTVDPDGRTRVSLTKTPNIQYQTATQVQQNSTLPQGADPALAAENLKKLPAGLPQGVIDEFSKMRADEQENFLKTINSLGPKGIEIANKAYQMKLAEAPANKQQAAQTIVEAVKDSPPGQIPAALISPITGTIAGNADSPWGASRDQGRRKHSGVDWQAPNKSPVLSMTGGKVLDVKYDKNGYDHYVNILGDDGVIRRYAPHAAVIVKKGDRVQQGQQIGIIGRGHLHYEEIPKELNGKHNSVWDEFIANGDANTQQQRGTRDPLVSNNVKAGTKVTAGQPFGMIPAPPSVVPQVADSQAIQPGGKANLGPTGSAGSTGAQTSYPSGTAVPQQTATALTYNPNSASYQFLKNRAGFNDAELKFMGEKGGQEKMDQLVNGIQNDKRFKFGENVWYKEQGGVPASEIRKGILKDQNPDLKPLQDFMRSTQTNQQAPAPITSSTSPSSPPANQAPTINVDPNAKPNYDGGKIKGENIAHFKIDGGAPKFLGTSNSKEGHMFTQDGMKIIPERRLKDTPGEMPRQAAVETKDVNPNRQEQQINQGSMASMSTQRNPDLRNVSWHIPDNTTDVYYNNDYRIHGRQNPMKNVPGSRYNA